MVSKSMTMNDLERRNFRYVAFTEIGNLWGQPRHPKMNEYLYSPE